MGSMPGAAVLAVIGFTALCILAVRGSRGWFRPWPAISILVLAKNQEAVIEGFVRELLRLTSASRCLTFDVIIVDYGSSDATPQILERLGRRLPIKILIWRDDLFPGCCAFEAGYLACDYPVTMVLNLDGDSRVPDLLAAVEVVRRGAGGLCRERRRTAACMAMNYELYRDSQNV